MCISLAEARLYENSLQGCIIVHVWAFLSVCGFGVPLAASRFLDTKEYSFKVEMHFNELWKYKIVHGCEIQNICKFSFFFLFLDAFRLRKKRCFRCLYMVVPTYIRFGLGCGLRANLSLLQYKTCYHKVSVECEIQTTGIFPNIRRWIFFSFFEHCRKCAVVTDYFC